MCRIFRAPNKQIIKYSGYRSEFALQRIFSDREARRKQAKTRTLNTGKTLISSIPKYLSTPTKVDYIVKNVQLTGAQAALPAR